MHAHRFEKESIMEAAVVGRIYRALFMIFIIENLDLHTSCPMDRASLIAVPQGTFWTLDG